MARKIRTSSMAEAARDLMRSPKAVEDIDRELEQLSNTWTALMAMREAAAKVHGVTKAPPTLPTTVVTRRRNEAYPTEPIKDLEVVEGSRAYFIHKILTDAGRPVSYRELEDEFSKTPAGVKKSPRDKPHYSGLQALKMKGHCVIYKGHITTPEILKRFKANVAAGVHPDIEERPRYNSLWADEIAKYLKARNDWTSSKEVADHLSTLTPFTHLKDTHVRTCTVLYNMKNKRGLVEKRGQGKGAKWRLAQDTDADKLRAAEEVASTARH